MFCLFDSFAHRRYMRTYNQSQRFIKDGTLPVKLVLYEDLSANHSHLVDTMSEALAFIGECIPSHAVEPWLSSSFITVVHSVVD